ncbi:MAG: helix-turn-helix transcriptional regulator [Thermocrispum sp.]
MNRTDRLYAIVEELRAVSPRPLSVPKLAGRFEVSSRTIERDLQALQQSGVPIYAEPGRTGGYVLDKRMSLPPVNFTPQEAAAIAVALAADASTPFHGPTRTALRKVLAAMPQAEAERAREVVGRVWLLRPQEPERTVPRVIQDAIVAGHALRLRYGDAAGVVSERVVEPTAFVNGPSHWYLVAWCRLRDRGRAFRLDRIVAATDTGEPIVRRPFDEVATDLADLDIRTPELA